MQTIETPTATAEVQAINITPILTPLLAMLKSRKFIMWSTAVAVSVLVSFVQELKPIQNQLFVLIGTLALGNILGTAYEDGKEKASQFIETNPIEDPFTDLKQTALDLLLSDTTDQSAIAEQIAMMRDANRQIRN